MENNGDIHGGFCDENRKLLFDGFERSVLVLTQLAGCEKPAPSSCPDVSARWHRRRRRLSASTTASPSSGTLQSDSGKLTTAHAVLDKMVDAYRKAPSYEDFATVELWEAGQTEPRRADFRVVFQRPNKLRMTCYQGELACDGKQWFGYSKDIPFSGPCFATRRRLSTCQC